MPLQLHHIKKHGWLFLLLALFIVCGSIWYEQKPTNSPPPTATPSTPPKPSYVDQKLSTMSLRDKIASLFIFHTPGTNPASLASYMTMYKPGGLIFMDDNIPVTNAELVAETSALVTNKQLPPLLAVDEEGDTVKRLADDTFPGALTLPSLPPSATAAAFTQRSSLLKSVGLNLNFGIDADVTSDANAFIFPRVLGTTPQQAADRVAQAVAGSHGFTLTTLKHFPGHGETGADSHTSIPTTTVSYATWQSRDAIPFEAGITAGADAVMFGQLRYSAIDQAPATLSTKWHSIIRNDLGFKGLIITDDMIMLQDSGEPTYTDPVTNAIAAIAAGNTMLLYVLNHGGGNTIIDPNTLINGVMAAVQNGRISLATIDTDAKAVLTARYNLGKMLYG